MRIKVLLLAGAVAFGAGPVMAGEPSDWVRCDGLAKPENAAVTLGRLVPAIMTAGLMGLPEASREAPAAQGSDGVKACDTVLADPMLDRYWARKVNLLKARALHQVEAGNLDAALADLTATHEVAAGNVDDATFARSLGASTQLFEAATKLKKERFDEASALAIKAADARPYSLEVGLAAVRILNVDPRWSPDKDRVLTRVAALEPDLLVARAQSREWGGQYAAAAADWSAAADSQASSLGDIGLPRGFTLPATTGDPVFVARAALAFARAGQNAQAGPLIARFKAAAAAPPAADDKDRLASLAATLRANQAKTAQRFITVAEAWVQVNDGKIDEARATLETLNNELPATPATLDLIQKLRPPTPAGMVSLAPSGVAQMEMLMASNRTDALKRLDPASFAKALPPLERADRSYSKQSAWFKPNGFKDKKTADGKGASIEFSGAFSTHAAVEEMMLLRAAQLARDAGKPGFVIRKRADYQQYMVQTMYGAEISRSANGFKTTAEVQFVDTPPEVADGLVFNADKVWNDLSPIYTTPAQGKS
ncbi:hypothetical protein [Caulobacter sp. BK020]|uniref:hypothetical protein n=1 Tax=Caulobacter sp. BK020 TaxID=2512117 RepID=UPI00104B084C|nr:hypothetical protein [Caulobacter sp. BK020]TCS14052.1 hypothetical protein EV278_10899 [Caulobacter sp. BK020]